MQPVDELRPARVSSTSPASGSVVFVTQERRRSTDSSASNYRHRASTPSSLSSPPLQNGESSDAELFASEKRAAGELDVGEWLNMYASGALGGNESAPEPPKAIAQLLQAELAGEQTSSRGSPDTETEVHFFPGSAASLSSQGDSSSAQAALDFYAKNGHLVAPKMPLEAERLKLTRKYGLDRPRRRAAIDSICRLAQRCFKIPTVVISLTFEDDQVLGGEVGFGPVEPRIEERPRRLALEPAFCTHAMVSAQEPGKTFIVRDAKQDWRFKKSPYVAQKDGISFYAAANVHLPTDLLEHEASRLPKTLPVGALCLIDNKPRGVAEFGVEDRETLQGFAGLIARELILGYEQDQRATAEAQSNILERFMHDALISSRSGESEINKKPTVDRRPSQARPAARQAPLSPNAKRVNASPATAAAFDETPAPADPSETYQYAASQLVKLTSATSSAILDLRAFRSDKRDVARRRNGTPLSETVDPRGRVRLLSSHGDIDWPPIIDGHFISDAVMSVLAQHENPKASAALQSNAHLAAILSPDIKTTLSLPVFDVDGSPALLVIMTSSEKHSSFDTSDVRFARNIGAVVVAHLLRQRAMEADRAKLAFVASVSHELRTPLHGVKSQVELIREFSTSNQLRRIAPLLDTADVCLESLSEVLDDTLDFAKLSQHASLAEARQAHLNSMVETDLEQIAEEVEKAVWVRKQRVDLVKDNPSIVTYKDVQTPEVTKVDLVLEVQKRRGGWKAWADVGGLKRCLLNLVGNALKFTTHGHVKLTLRELPPSPDTKTSTVLFEVEDTGCGMDDAFASKAFLPFVQADPFADGAGLGLSIVASIVQRMSGTVQVRSRLGKGTLVTFAIPISFISARGPDTDTPDPSPAFRRRVISDELAALFTPGSPMSLLGSPTPNVIGVNHFDDQSAQSRVDAAARATFSRAIEATRPRTQVLNAPSGRQRAQDAPARPPHIESSELGVEVAKLSLSTALATSPDLARSTGFLSAANPSSEDPSRPPSPIVPPTNTPIRVLVADDNRIALNILAKLFSAKKISYEAVENGQQAIDAYKAGGGSFNLVLADVQMPVKDGVEASYEIREYEQAMGWPRCRIVAVTGLSNEVDMRAAGVIDNDGPIDAWVVKGKSLRVLLDEVYRVQRDLDEAAATECRA